MEEDPSSRPATTGGGGGKRSGGRGRRGPQQHQRVRPFASSPSNQPHRASGGGAAVEGGGSDGSLPGSTGSGNRAWRKRHRWHSRDAAVQQHRSARNSQTPHRSGARSTSAAAPTEQEHKVSPPSARGLEEDEAVPSRSSTRRREGTIVINGSVRCVDLTGMLQTKSLKDLIRVCNGSMTEADTPCLGPAAAPACVANAMVRPGSDEGSDAPAPRVLSPMLAFTLDSIATPNTFAALKDPPVCASGDGAVGGRGGGSALALAEGGSGVPGDNDLLPTMHMESPYQYILRSYNPTAETFDYYETPDARATFLDKCFMLCQQATEILSQESLMACVYAPVYVFGDIHGNFADLSYFLRSVLAFNDIHLSPCNILCLGDYVDRGPFSLECVLILLALKVEAPHKVTLLRGNHEDRVVCGDRRTYGSDCFLAQCQTIFGPGDGMKLFHAVTAVFRHLPLAAEIVVSNAPNRRPTPAAAAQPQAEGADDVDLAVSPPAVVAATTVGGRTNAANASTSTNHWKRATDQRHKSHMERILCTHGGIPRFSAPPRDNDMLAFLRSPDFPRLLTLFPNNPLVRDDPDAQLGDLDQDVLQRAWYVMFDLMWSDPTLDDSGPNINEWGFGINMRGNNVVSFSGKAVDTFLEAFQYTMLFRAHQEKAHGIRLSKSQRVLTIFSSSNYLGHGNGAGCVIVTPQGQVQLVVKTSE